MITLLSLLSSVYASCVTNNINLNNLGIVSKVNYRLPLSTYFSGDGLTYTLPAGTQFQTVQALVPSGLQKQTQTVIATAVQNANGDPNVQTNQYAALYSTSTGTTPSFAVAFGQLTNGQVIYGTLTADITNKAAGTFACSSIAFYASESVIVGCSIATATSIQQLFYYLQSASQYTIPAPLVGTNFPQAIQTIQTRIQISYQQQVPYLCMLGFNGQTTGTSNTGTSIFNCFVLTITAGVPSITNPAIIITPSSSYFIDFYVSSNGYSIYIYQLVFLLQFLGGLQIYPTGQATPIATINPLGTQEYIALGVHEVQLSETVYDFLIAVSSTSGIASTIYNPSYPTFDYVVNTFIATNSSSARGGRLYINYDYIIVNNGLLLSVFPGPANRINQGKEGSLLLGQVTLAAPSQTTFSNLQNLVTVANNQQQGVYSINNPLLTTSSFTGTQTLTVTATDVNANTCSVTLNFETVTTSEIISTQNTATASAQLTAYYPLQTSIDFSSWFQGPALQAPSSDLYTTQQVNQPNKLNPVTYIYSQIFPNPLNYEETSIQISTDGDHLYILEVDSVGNIIKTYPSITPADPIQKITQFSLGQYGGQLYWGYLDSGANTIYLYLDSKFSIDIPPIPVDNTANPTYYTFTQFQIVDENIFGLAENILFYTTSFEKLSKNYQTFEQNAQMWFNTLAYGNIFFVSSGNSLYACKFFQGTLYQIGGVIKTTNTITSVGVTGYGLYVITTLGQTQQLLFYPRSYLFLFQNSFQPITVSTYGYTLSNYVVSTYDHFYVYGFNGKNVGILVFQESSGYLDALYYVVNQGDLDNLLYFSVVGWPNFDAILFGTPSTIGSQPTYTELYPTITVTYTAQNFTSLQNSEQTQIVGSSQIPGTTSVSIPLNITTYNYIDYVSVASSTTQGNINLNGLYQFDPRTIFNGNIASIVSYVTDSDYVVTYSNVLNNSAYQSISSSVVSSAVVTNTIGGSTQQSILLQVTGGTIYNVSTYNTKSKIYQTFVPNLAGVAQFKAGCVLTFVDFFTQQPVTICQDTTTIYFIQYTNYNDHTQQFTANYTPTADYLLQSAEYYGGVLMLVLNNGQDTIAQFGLYVATTVSNSQGTFGQFVPLRFNDLTGWSNGIPVILLNVGIPDNILNTILNCATDCSIEYGSLMTLEDGTTTGYIYQSQLSQATLQGIYTSGNPIPIVSATVTQITLPTTNGVEFTVTLPNIIGTDDSYYAIAQLGNYTNLGSVGSIAPVIFVSGSLSYWIDLYFYQDLYWKGSLECTLLGYESTEGTVPVSVATANGTVAVGYADWVASYGNITNICKSNQQVATIIGAYQYNATNILNAPSTLQIIPTQPQAYILTPYYQILTFLPEYYVAVVPSKSSSPYINAATQIPVQLNATSLNNLNTTSVVFLKLSNTNLGTPDDNSTHWIWALYISLGMIALLGTLGYLCYQSQKPKTDYYAEV